MVLCNSCKCTQIVITSDANCNNELFQMIVLGEVELRFGANSCGNFRSEGMCEIQKGGHAFAFLWDPQFIKLIAELIEPTYK